MSFLGMGNDSKMVLAALSKSSAMIEFDLNGNILTANENFCKALGYELSEIKGKHHRIFCDPAYASTTEYTQFWANLAKGASDQQQFKRITKSGSEIWIEASYNPVYQGSRPYKVVKIATDITASKLKSIEDAGKLDAISRSQAVIEFKPSGEVLTANQNFLNCLGYQLSEIEGKHHSMFCDADYVRSQDYKDLWQSLNAGQVVAEEFKRIGKGGKVVWIQASYNPIFDMNGKVFKVVKFATDVTGRVNAVDEIASALERLANGDLEQRLSRTFIPSFEKLRTDFNFSIDKLQNTLRSIADSARTIGTGTGEIRSASNDLAKRTEQQAASVEETAAALEEISTTVADAASRATDASKLVAETKINAENSGVTVRKAIDAMSAIAASSQEVSNIIGVIDEIAFQTNLLALNAGVEAARAGEAGKGFAVVAQEVRELAQRSASAAKEIKSLINTSGNQVKNGVELVGQTGAALEEIVQQVQNVDRNVHAIVEASKEQSIGLQEVSRAINTIDQGTQQNAAMVEQSSAASHGLASEVETLNNLVAQFKIGAGSNHRAPAAQYKATATGSPSRTKPNTSSKTYTSHGNAAVKSEQWEDF